MPLHPSVVFLDVGDTLVDGRPELDHYCKVFQEHGYEAPKEAILSAYLQSWDEAAPDGAHPEASATQEKYEAFRAAIYTSFVERCGCTEAPTIEAITTELMAYSDASNDQLQLFPDTIQVLSRLAESYRLVAVSNWYWSLNNYLDNHGIGAYFEAVITSAQIGYRKPHPKIFEHALALANVKPEEVVMVGDSYESDVLGAQGVGIRAVLLDRWGVPPEADCPVISSLSELPDTLAMLSS